MIKVSFWGDCKIDEVDQVLLSEETKSLIESSKLNVINFEAPVNNEGNPISKTGPTLAQSPKTPLWLEQNSFNVISLANNHIMDFGVEGYEETLALFKNSLLLGAGHWEEAYKIKVLEIENLKIGFLSLTHCEFGTLTDKYDEESNIGTAWICHPDIPSIIVNGKKEVDYLFIISHAGIEYIDVPLPEWRDVYKGFIELGADAVVASHPHVVQGWEVYKDRPIFYSLGNFCFQKSNSQAIPPGWNDSLCVVFTLDQKPSSEIQFQVHAIHYDGQRLGIRLDAEMQSYVERVNQVLNDSMKYIERVNQHCAGLLLKYQNSFSLSGYHFLPSLSWSFIGKVIGLILKRKRNKPVHIINNLRCESHRWAILRAILLKSRV